MNHEPAASHAGSAAPPHGELPVEFAELAGLARRIAGTAFAAITLTGSGVAWSGDGAPPTAAAADFRGHAGWALRSREGDAIGTLAVYHTAPLNLSDEQRALLEALARQAVAIAGLRARVAELEILSPGRGGSASARAASFADELIENAPVAIYYADSSEIDWCNPEYRRMFQLHSDQSADDWAQGIHPDDRRRIEETWSDFCRSPRTMTFDYRTRQDEEGGVRFFSEKVTPIEGSGGYVGTISDFTDLVNIRADLRKAESLFGNTFDQAPIGILFASREGRLERYNRAFCTLLGYSDAELAGMSTEDIVPAEDAAECAVRLERLWNAEEPFLDLERRYRRKDGSDVWVRSTTALVRDGERVDCRVEYLRDVTQRRQLTAELIRQRTLLEAVIADLPMALVACDVAGNITHYNRVAATEMRWASAPSSASTAEAMDVFLMDGVTPVAEEDRPLARALRGETITNLELTVVPHELAPRTTLSSARRLVDPDGETLGAVAVIQDTTERKYQEIELERVNKELITASREAGMAEVATNVLHNVGNILNSVNISSSIVAERVRQSKAGGVARLAGLMAEQGERLGEFMSSDPRGKRIPQYLAALGEQLAADQRTALEELVVLRDNLEHIKDTVAMQQSYAKLCGVTETVEVADLVEDSLRLNAGAFARHGVALQREFAAVPSINVDKHKVLQILVNLVRNAKYACDDSGRSDKLITLRIEGTPGGVRIAVIDNGIGIPPENMGKLFQHGFTTRESGHGFGLHSGALAAQELGGTLRAESAGEGRGAAFILDLPANPSPRTARS
jgi:PAS domain S-box-containing protein